MGFKITGEIKTPQGTTHEQFLSRLYGFLKNEGFHFCGETKPITEQEDKDGDG